MTHVVYGKCPECSGKVTEGVCENGHVKPEVKVKLPYPWCREPNRCRFLGSCPRDPNCGD